MTSPVEPQSSVISRAPSILVAMLAGATVMTMALGVRQTLDSFVELFSIGRGVPVSSPSESVRSLDKVRASSDLGSLSKEGASHRIPTLGGSSVHPDDLAADARNGIVPQSHTGPSRLGDDPNSMTSALGS